MSGHRAIFRSFLLLVAAVVLLSLSGCTANIGGRDYRLRPGVRVIGTAVQEGDGESEYLPTYEPEGDTIFFFVTTRY